MNKTSLKAAKVLLQILNRVPPMQRERLLADELDHIIEHTIDSVLRQLLERLSKQNPRKRTASGDRLTS